MILSYEDLSRGDTVIIEAKAAETVSAPLFMSIGIAISGTNKLFEFTPTELIRDNTFRS